MRLDELFNRPVQAHSSVPSWMLGCFRRRSISFANGDSDQDTQVFWVQSRNLTIDLRLPQESEQPVYSELGQCSPDDLQQLARYEGWLAQSHWDGQQLQWQGGVSLQLHNPWPEPALLHRVGNCMVEFAPSGAYLEDWRLQPSRPGPLVSLQLIEERCLDSGQCLHKGGGLIICGDYAALVLGRPQPPSGDAARLSDWLSEAEPDMQSLEAAFAFETSLARGSLKTGYTVEQSTDVRRLHQPLIDLHGFEWLENNNQLRQQVTEQGRTKERLFVIDSLEPNVDFALNTPTEPSADKWFAREAENLTRYTQPIY